MKEVGIAFLISDLGGRQCIYTCEGDSYGAIYLNISILPREVQVICLYCNLKSLITITQACSVKNLDFI